MIRLFRDKLLFKLILIFFVAIILPIGIAALLINDHIEDKYCENIESSLGWGKNYVISNFSNEIKLLNASILKVQNDSKFISSIKYHLGDKDDYLIQVSLSQILTENNLDFIYVYCNNTDIVHRSGKFIQISEELLKRKNIEPEISYYNSKFITQAKINIEINDVETGNITIFLGKILSEQMLYDLSSIMDLDFILLKENNGRMISTYSTLFDTYGQNYNKGEIELENVSMQEKMENVEILGKKYYLLSFPLTFLDEKYTGVILAENNPSYLDNIKKYLYIFFFGLLFFILVSLVFIHKTLFKPISKLLSSINEISDQIEKEKPIEKIIVKTSDEIFLLSEAYNSMASTLGQSFSKVKYLQNYLLNIIESMPSSLMALDKNGRVTQWNHAAEDFTGVLKNDAKGKVIWNLVPDLGIETEVLNSVHDEKRQREFYKESVWNGEKRNLNIHIFPLIANGVQGNVIRIDDITEMKNKEEQLLQAQKMETIGTLAGGIAHDFNNILSGIVGVISILTFKMDKDEDIPKSLLKEYLEIMEESGKRAGEIVQRLLTLSKKQNTHLEAVNLSDVVKHVEKICLNSFDKRIEIKKIGTENNTLINADFTQIEQLLLNLSINSAHAMTIMRDSDEKQGGILTFEIVESADPSEIRKFLNDDLKKEYIKLMVHDTGVGMTRDIIKQIYEPFFSTKELDSGTGLGLTMVYNIVTQFNGFIDVESVPNIGSVFSIYFPKYSFDAKVINTEKDPVLKRGEGKILVIDDELVLRELANSMLTQCGYEVLTAKDGVEGLEVYKQEFANITAVMLDMVMPKMNGKDTYIELKKINPDVKVLLASGFTKDDRVEEVLSLGVKDFIQKPYTIYELSDIISKIINGDLN
ncbi:MAG: response regulator [Candidatus Delongbacteria bacterium]|nr:response regulator [Candidatus Delongbacteria bacterium]